MRCWCVVSLTFNLCDFPFTASAKEQSLIPGGVKFVHPKCVEDPDFKVHFLNKQLLAKLSMQHFDHQVWNKISVFGFNFVV